MLAPAATTLLPAPFGPDAVPAWLGCFAELRAAPDLVLDAQGQDLEPAGITLLAALAAARRGEGKRTRGIDSQGALAIPDLEAARLAGDTLAERLEQTLPQAAPSVVRLVRFVLEELGANIVQHSGAPETGFGALRVWPDGGGRFQLAFADAGVGFLRSLTRNPQLAARIPDDADAIQLAVEKGLSGTAGRANMGMGLGVLCDLSDRLGADLWIVSGSALWHRRTVATGHRVATIRAVSRYPGAWVCLQGPPFPSRR